MKITDTAGGMNVRRQSKFIFMVIIIMLCFIAINIFLFEKYINLVDNDAATINSLGIIRGSIQRFSKLEMINVSNDEIKDNINSIIKKYEDDNVPYLKLIENSWKKLIDMTLVYRKDPSPENRDLLLIMSEECWTIADQAVLINQYIAENKVKYLTLPITLLVLEFIVGVALLFIIKKYVYDNLESFALYDLLTDVYSRRYFFEYLNKEISRAHRKETIFSLIMFDIDRFKNVNDTYGHSKGDYVLKTIAIIAQNNIRKSDILSRIGGEEFTIILPGTTLEKAVPMAERVRQAIESYNFDTVGSLTVSLGVTTYKPDDNCDEIFRRADAAMYLAKNNGRNRTEVYH